MTIIVKLAELGSNGLTFVGDWNAGYVSLAGDINGDGIADVIVGSPNNSRGGDEAGGAYVVFGEAGASGQVDLASLRPADGYFIQGRRRGDGTGWVSGGGDFNHDGFADVIVGAPLRGHTGKAYVVFGKADGFGTLDLADFTPADGVVISGNAKLFGEQVSYAGDFNGDGIDDLLASTPFKKGGAVYLLFGQADGRSEIDIAHVAPSDGFVIQGAPRGSELGRSTSSAGDVNGDGLLDIIIGAAGNTNDPAGDPGRAYVIFGKTDSVGPIDVANLDPTDGFAIKGGAAGDHAGASVSSAGDMNGDGYDDLIVGAVKGHLNKVQAGQAYVIFGKADGLGDIDLAHLAPKDGFVMAGTRAYEHAGASVAGAGDVNGDGFADVIIGAYSYGTSGRYGTPGRAYVIYGKAEGLGSIDLETITDKDGLAIDGPGGPVINVGGFVSAAGDVNGDGFDDVMVGTFGGLDHNGAYVVFGTAPSGDVTRVGSDAAQTIRGGAGNDRLEGLGGDDVLIGAGGNDTIKGGTGADQLSGGDGADILYGGADKDDLTGGVGADSFHFSKGGTAPDALNADTITDFHQAEHDLIDLTDYDADPGTKGTTDPFTFIGTAAFSGAVGELRYEVSGSDTLVSGDTDGDKTADFTIRLTGNITLTAADFLFATPATPAHAFLTHPDLTANPMLHLA